MSRSSLRRLAGPAFAGCLALVGSVLPVFATPAAAASPDLVISQVYGGGGNAGAPFTHDYVELFNRGSAPVTTADLSVQYASATGTGNFQAAPLSTVTVPAGGYYLLQLAGGSVGAALPTADATGTLNLSGTAGKVVLVDGTAALACNGGSAPCTAEQSARIVDLVGFGNANFAEGSPAPTLSSSTAAFRAGGGCTDTDANAADFAAGTPSPRTSIPNGSRLMPPSNPK